MAPPRHDWDQRVLLIALSTEAMPGSMPIRTSRLRASPTHNNHPCDGYTRRLPIPRGDGPELGHKRAIAAISSMSRVPTPLSRLAPPRHRRRPRCRGMGAPIQRPADCDGTKPVTTTHLNCGRPSRGSDQRRTSPSGISHTTLQDQWAVSRRHEMPRVPRRRPRPSRRGADRLSCAPSPPTTFGEQHRRPREGS